MDYKCDLRDNKAAQKRNLERHMKSVHVVQYKYDLCDYRAAQKRNFEKHAKSVHTVQYN